MRVVSNKCTIMNNEIRYVKGIPFDIDDETGTRLLKQGTVERIETPKTNIIDEPVKIEEIKTKEPETKKKRGKWSI